MELREKLSTFKLSPHLFLCLRTRKIKGVVLEPPSKLVPPKWYQGLIANVPPMFLGIMLMLFFLVSTRLVSDKKYPRASYPKNMFLLICFYYVKREVHFILFLSLLFYLEILLLPLLLKSNSNKAKYKLHQHEHMRFSQCLLTMGP